MNDFLYIYVHLNLIRKGTDCCSKNRTNCYDQHDHNNHHGNHFEWCFFTFSVISKSHFLYLITINSLALFYHEIGDFSNRAYTKRDWDKSPSLLIVFGMSSKTQWLSGLYYADFISFYSPTQLCGGGTTKSNSNE